MIIFDISIPSIIWFNKLNLRDNMLNILDI